MLGESDLLAVGVALVVLVASCWLLLTVAGTRMVVDIRAQPEEAPPGDPIEVHARTSVTSTLTVGELLCRLETSEGLVPTRDLAVQPEPARRGVSLPFQTAPRRRGRHTIGPMVVTTRDPFGIATSTVRGSETVDVLGLPVVHPVGLQWLPDRGAQVGAFTGADLGRSTELDVGLREHRPEDGLRRVHWPTSARLGRLMTRTDEPTADRDCLVILDDRARSHRGATFEAAVATAASVATALAGLGHRVWLWQAAGPPAAPHSGWTPAAVRRHLAAVQPSPVVELDLDSWALQREVGAGPVIAVTTPYADLPHPVLGRIAGWASAAHLMLIGPDRDMTPDDAERLGRGWTVSHHPTGTGLAASLLDTAPAQLSERRGGR